MKKIKILIMSFCIIFMLSNNVFALGDIFDIGDKWTDLGNEKADIGIDSNDLKDMSNGLYYLLLNIATGVAVIVGGILGIQYMTAGVSKKVQVKESLFPYMISCIVVFGSLGIWGLVVRIMASF